jgi:hypothetical protein
MKSLQVPSNIPKKGFYYHYKHDPKGSVNNYAYEVMGVGSHTEEDETFMVVYRPLYETASVYQAGKHFDLRPLPMFMEEVTKDGKTHSRFTPITDQSTLDELQEIKKKMYE